MKSCLFTDTYITLLTRHMNVLKVHTSLACGLHFLNKLCPILSVYFCYTRCIDRYTGRGIHTCNGAKFRVDRTQTEFCLSCLHHAEGKLPAPRRRLSGRALPDAECYSDVGVHVEMFSYISDVMSVGSLRNLFLG